MNSTLKIGLAVLFSAALLGVNAQQEGGMGQGGMGMQMGRNTNARLLVIASGTKLRLLMSRKF